MHGTMIHVFNIIFIGNVRYNVSYLENLNSIDLSLVKRAELQ